MGKGNDLWDDSALINAFDHAMSTYKNLLTKRWIGGGYEQNGLYYLDHLSSTAVATSSIQWHRDLEMHSTNSNDKSTKEGNHASDRNEKDVILVEKTTGTVEFEDSSSNISEVTTKTCLPSDNAEIVPEDISTQGNNFCADAHPPGPDPCSSSFPSTDGKNYCYSDQQSMDYDQLVRQYYELEEQKQKVIQQLYQANYWNYQTPVQCSTCQLPQVSGNSVSENGRQTACSLCSCHCIAVPLISSACTGSCNCSFQLACCSGSQTHQVAGKQISADNDPHSTATASAVDRVNHSKADDNAVKLGMMAINRAMNSMKVELCATSNDSEEKGGMCVSSGTLDGNGPQSISSEADLTAVLNAWYLAGFHTGRYLSEQSKKNAQQ